MRYKVPQNIDMQDRILGPLTMVQFIYAVVGSGICYVIYMSIPKPFSLILVVPIGLFTAAISFLKVNERPFLDFFLSVIQFMSTPKERVWHHENLSDLNVEVYQTQRKETNTYQPKNYSRQDLTELAKRLDQNNH